jgi:myo-inositol-1(or 4)-monophosphatase
MEQEQSDQALLAQVITAVVAAADAIKLLFSLETRPSGVGDIMSRIQTNDEISMSILQEHLIVARPIAILLDDEAGVGTLPSGEYWIVDPVEGAINHIHGMDEWCVTATLVRDNDLILTVVHVPITGHTYSALRGAGAFLDGKAIRVSAKPDLRGAMVGTGQARPGESLKVHQMIGASVTAMLQTALTVRVSVPATLQLIQVAAGRMDGFWQFSQVRSGLASGALLVAEAGGVVTDFEGNQWTFDSPGFLATTPQFSATIGKLLSDIA